MPLQERREGAFAPIADELLQQGGVILFAGWVGAGGMAEKSEYGRDLASHRTPPGEQRISNRMTALARIWIHYSPSQRRSADPMLRSPQNVGPIDVASTGAGKIPEFKFCAVRLEP
jgi:hypothetical protein